MKLKTASIDELIGLQIAAFNVDPSDWLSAKMLFDSSAGDSSGENTPNRVVIHRDGKAYPFLRFCDSNGAIQEDIYAEFSMDYCSDELSGEIDSDYIGKGSSATVKLLKNENNEHFALRILPTSKVVKTPEGTDMAVSIDLKLNHKTGSFVTEKKQFVQDEQGGYKAKLENVAYTYQLTALVRGVSLHDISPENLSFSNKISVIMDICTALIPVHQNGIIHGDIHGGNLIRDDQGVFHLIDWGEATVLPEGASFVVAKFNRVKRVNAIEVYPDFNWHMFSGVYLSGIDFDPIDENPAIENCLSDAQERYKQKAEKIISYLSGLSLNKNEGLFTSKSDIFLLGNLLLEKFNQTLNEACKSSWLEMLGLGDIENSDAFELTTSNLAKMLLFGVVTEEQLNQMPISQSSRDYILLVKDMCELDYTKRPMVQEVILRLGGILMQLNQEEDNKKTDNITEYESRRHLFVGYDEKRTEVDVKKTISNENLPVRSLSSSKGTKSNS